MKKTIWSIDPKNIGSTKEVDESYVINSLFETEVPMPTGMLIPAWDNKTNSWYDAGANVDGQLKPVMAMVSQLIKQNASLVQRITALEKFHEQGTPMEDPTEGGAE
ncbi:hypothetical protein [Enterococcus sp. JM9B]|uniref:hypothetical protein n=1 Tax=Enterococcus sp. JM9B TaxID=1857216 RepID=UPI001F4241D8|nr:hypothetical protein [Enterococcus sp. JM9B]